MDARIKHIVERWYIEEPALFPVICTHDIEPNDDMDCPFRCGKGRIEYSPSLIAQLSHKQLELFLKAEAICILLRHPYERQPAGCKRSSLSLASSLVLADNYDFSGIDFKKPAEYRLPEHQSYEWYAIHLDKMDVAGQKMVVQPSTIGEKDTYATGNAHKQSTLTPKHSEQKEDSKDDYFELKMRDGTTVLVRKGKSRDTQTNNAQHQNGKKEETKGSEAHTDMGGGLELPAASADHSQLWAEDPFMQCSLDIMVEHMETWGTLPGNIVGQIKANTKARIDYRKVLSGFRASILSSKRHLTRMRPNRRSGFDNMGSIRRFDTNLLVAVDVSGSISNNVLRHFYSTINRMFKYGVEHIDVVQFDAILSEVKSIEKRFKKMDVSGRGGTSFQPVFDYIGMHPQYDGLIIFTDGCAPHPQLPKRLRTKIVWVCDSRKNYEKHRSWMRAYGRCCPMEV